MKDLKNRSKIKDVLYSYRVQQDNFITIFIQNFEFELFAEM